MLRVLVEGDPQAQATDLGSTGGLAPATTNPGNRAGSEKRSVGGPDTLVG